MSSPLHNIREALLTAIATITAAGSYTGGTYTYTWSAVDAVKVGTVPDTIAPLPMFRLLPAVRMVTEFGRTHRDQTTTATLSFIAIAPSILSTSDAGMDAAEAALEDLEGLIRLNMNLGELSEFIRVSSATLWGAMVEGVGEAGVVEGEIEIQFTVHRGT